MQTKPPTPTELLIALWDSHYGVSYPTDIVNAYWSRDLAFCERYGPALVDQSNPAASCTAFLHLIVGLKAGKGRMVDGDDSYIHRAWFNLFYGYHLDGFISQELWGYIARTLYVYSPPSNKSDALPGLRRAIPQFLMTPADYDRWARLPETVTAYRGICTDASDGLWKGVSWTLDPEYAATFAGVRAVSCYDQSDYTGWPRLLEGRFSCFAVLAVVDNGMELLVDHDMLDASNVTEVSPLAPSEIDAHIHRLVAQAAASRHVREARGLVGALPA